MENGTNGNCHSFAIDHFHIDPLVLRSRYSGLHLANGMNGKWEIGQVIRHRSFTLPVFDSFEVPCDIQCPEILIDGE